MNKPFLYEPAPAPANDPALQKGQHESTSEAMSDLVDAKIAAAEARSETGLAVAMGEVRLEYAKLTSRMEKMPTTAVLIGSMASAVGVVLAVVIAMMAYGAQWFGLGMDANTAAEAGAQRALKAFVLSRQEADAALDELRASRETPPPPTPPAARN